MTLNKYIPSGRHKNVPAQRATGNPVQINALAAKFMIGGHAAKKEPDPHSITSIKLYNHIRRDLARAIAKEMPA